MENKRLKGVLYGVGVGPGDPELITVKALKTLRHCPVIAAVSAGERGSTALKIAEAATDLSDKKIILLNFLMSRDKEKLRQNHLKNAGLLAGQLEKGSDVALLSLGDASLFASFSYMSDIIEEMGFEVRRVPGVASFCAAAAKLNISLTEMGEPLFVFPQIENEEGIKAALLSRGSKVFMKSGKGLKTLLRVIKEQGLSEKAFIAQNCGVQNERLIKGFNGEEISDDYFTTVIVRE